MITTLSEFQALPFFKTIAVANLDISSEEWLMLLEVYKSDQRQRLSFSYFINELAKIRKVDYSILGFALEREQPTRGVKRPRSTQSALSDINQRRFYHEPEPGSYLVTDSQGRSFGENSQNGIKKTTITAGQTPGGTRVRPFFSRNGDTYHLPETPQGKKIPICPPSPTFFKRHRPRRPEILSFVVELAVLLERQGAERPQSQRSAMGGVSAAEVFKRHGVEMLGIPGRDFHWSHLWAHFLGGPASDMVAATAQSNYTTLELVEKYIFNLLRDQKTHQVCVQVIPEYSEGMLIPDMLVYQLNWQETDKITGQVKLQHEEFRINPRSTRRLSAEQVEAIDSVRKAP